MDISFNTTEGKFKFRVCAVIVKDGKLLVATGGVPYYYLTGGKVKLGESAQAAILREIKEEIGVNSSIVRPLWLVENIYNDRAKDAFIHELGIYYLVKLPDDCPIMLHDKLTLRDSASGLKFTYQWVRFEQLKDIEFYPEFIKESIFSLPQSLTLITNDERN